MNVLSESQSATMLFKISILNRRMILMFSVASRFERKILTVPSLEAHRLKITDVQLSTK